MAWKLLDNKGLHMARCVSEKWARIATWLGLNTLAVSVTWFRTGLIDKP